MLVLDDVVYSANLGDSKAVLCRRTAADKNQLSFASLTKDHNPSNVSSVKIFGRGGDVKLILRLYGNCKTFPKASVCVVISDLCWLSSPTV